MNKRELIKYERALVEEKQRILKQGNHTNEVMDACGPDATGDLSSHRTHIADQGTENYQSEMASRLKGMEAKTLREINDALGRIQSGKFGKCESCGEDIPEGRLEVVPHARFCMKCLKKREG
jgi:RNA polymerase-binding transcription factor DksA